MVYLTSIKILTNVGFYDKFKYRLMPAGDSKYGGFNKFWRRMVAALFASSLTIALSYPFDLFFTKLAADMNPTRSTRLYNNTFDCFNLTQIEGGFKGCYKGAFIALGAAVPSTLFMIPLYDILSEGEFLLNNSRK
jgi:hypothetical protein